MVWLCAEFFEHMKRLALILLLSLEVSAQIPKNLPTSGLEWAHAANPQQYFDATGRRSAVFGKQTGQFEAWIWPIKLLHGFRVEFQQQGMPEPVRGEPWLAQVITRPESTTLIYAHPLFTVREIIWAPRDEPALLIFFDVDSGKPLSITAKFIPDFKPMWPASLGGQHSYWVDDLHGFALTDGTSKPTALVGSPAVGAFTEFMDHSLIGGEMLLRLQVTPEQARAGLVPLVMTLSMENEQGAETVYRDVLARARPLYDARVAYHKDFLARTLQIETPDPVINRAFVWAKIAIDSGWVCHPKYGCGMVAGYGPSGDGERPGFAWWFGGDGLIATWAMLDYGDTEGALQELRFLRARQRADGKMLHEMPQSVDLVDWFGKYGFAYMHADTTPMYLYTLGQYWRRTGDRKFLEEFWPSAKKAYEWCLTTVDSKDGLMDLTKAGLGAIEVGVLRGKVTKDIYTEGFWIGGLDAVADLAATMNDPVSADAKTRLAAAMKSLETQWWNEKGGYFAFGVTAGGERAEMAGVWPSVLMALAPELHGAQPQRQLETFASPELHSDWGVRWISDKSPLFDPISYNNGTVWPFMNTFASWAEYRHGFVEAAFTTLHDTAALTGIQSPGYMPEHMNGARFLPGERSVPHQLFSSVGVLVPLVRGLLGAAPDARATRYLGFAPALPAGWDWLRFSKLRVGAASVSGEIRREGDRLTARLNSTGRIASAQFKPAAHFGPPNWTVTIPGQKASRGENIAEVVLSPELLPADVLLFYPNTLELIPPLAEPNAGHRSEALKVIEFAVSPHQAQLTVAGLAGSTYELEFVSTLPKVTADAGTLTKTAQGYRLTLSFEGTDYVTRTVFLRY